VNLKDQREHIAGKDIPMENGCLGNGEYTAPSTRKCLKDPLAQQGEATIRYSPFNLLPTPLSLLRGNPQWFKVIFSPSLLRMQPKSLVLRTSLFVPRFFILVRSDNNLQDEQYTFDFFNATAAVGDDGKKTLQSSLSTQRPMMT